MQYNNTPQVDTYNCELLFNTVLMNAIMNATSGEEKPSYKLICNLVKL